MYHFYMGNVLLPITPEKLSLKIKNANKTLTLINEGEVSDAIGRLTDMEYYQTLTYEEKQRYNLTLSEKYLRALERFRRECEFDLLLKKM